MSLTASFPETISAYHSERWRHVRHALKDVSENPDVAMVHHARVEIKKLVALYEFLEYSSGEKCRPALHPLRKIFKLLGRLRDNSNMLDLCHEFGMETVLMAEKKGTLKRIHKKANEQIRNQKEEFRKIKHSYAKLCHHVDTAIWAKYLKAKYKEIQAMTSSPSAEQLHDARKCIKHLLYNAQFTGTASNKIKNADSLDKLQDLIGCWHDLVVFLEALIESGADTTHHPQFTAVMRKEKKLRKEISGSIALCFPQPAGSRGLLL